MYPTAAVQTDSHPKFPKFQTFVPYRDRLISRKQLSEWLDITPDRLSIWATNGQGPPTIRIGRKRRYRVGSVLDWLAQQSVSAASEAEG
jgi:hypothetical protein